MRKKGFTLVELLAVIVLLSILVMLVIPSITGSLKKQENETDALMLDMIEKAAQLYVENNSSSFKENSYGYYCLTLKELVDKDYLKEGIEIDGKDITNTKSLKIFYDSNEMLFVEECAPPFKTDSWETIVENVQNGKSNLYSVGDEKEITLEGFGTYTVRVANNSTPVECSTQGFSQTACGFVIEFVDIITHYKMNPSTDEYEYGYNIGGWEASEMRSYVNNEIYNSLPTALKNNIINTTVVSGHGSNDSSNFTTIDKLYLLSTKEVYGTKDTNDTLEKTRQLDYYKNIGVTTNNYSGAIKTSKGSIYWWWLRSAISTGIYNFYYVYTDGYWYDTNPLNPGGVTPAFRI